MSEKKDIKGITTKKSENFSEWYTQLVQKADLADYSAVSGCIIYKPNSYAIWEKIVAVVDGKLKKLGVRNAYFPLFIPEKLLQKEAEHVEGFAPEVAWVTYAGNTKLPERLAIRPTSETIMYDAYAKWIRSHHDLPLKINQWNNVVRWEFKHPIPFLRGREFLWNEGHTVFATKKEAEKEKEEIIEMYSEVCKEYLALPFLVGKKSEREKFAGAEYTLSLEFLMPNGRAIQGPDFHHDGQNFARAFEITFLDNKGERQYAWQNTWAITTRMLGVLFAIHGDDKGLVLPPKIAPTQIVIVPILFEENKDKIVQEAGVIAQKLSKQFSVHLDDRDDYSAGWKFNEWEVKGVPLRIELGPKDLQKEQVLVVRRDTGEKHAFKIKDLEKEVALLLDGIHQKLYEKAEKRLKENIVKVENLAEAKKQIELQKIVFAPWCGSSECEENFKFETGGAKTLNSPLSPPKIAGEKCFACEKEASLWFYFGKSY